MIKNKIICGVADCQTNHKPSCVFCLLHLTWLTGRDANGSLVSQMSQSGYPTLGAKTPEAREDLGG